MALFTALIVGAIAGGAAGFAGGWLATQGDSNSGAIGPQNVRVLPSETNEPVSAAAAAAVEAVVNIDVSGATATDSEALPEGHPGVPFQGNGSGVAFMRTEDGGTYIITNDHVVAGTSSIVVRGVDQEPYVAELIGTDPDTDIAVIKVEASLPVVDLGNSDELLVGQLVVAVGSPYGLDHSITSGVISALGRSLPNGLAAAEGIYPLVDVIQTDAAINPGNSGGALVDRRGRLIGINTAIYSGDGSSGGIGFAVPVNRAVRVAGDLIDAGSVRHPFLGVVGRDVTAAEAQQEGYASDEGALVIELTPGTNAVKAGIEPGDIIVSLDESRIRSMDDLILEVRRTAVGDVVVVGLYRGDEYMDLEMTVGDKPDDLNIETAPESEETTPAQE
ncbi:MAG: trypsin-like peptidase domain-containing protein [Actinomycetota bacterium]|nr:trypsin-like peptidase domain-containing protein [Actinomycetota bacterium]